MENIAFQNDMMTSNYQLVQTALVYLASWAVATMIPRNVADS